MYLLFPSDEKELNFNIGEARKERFIFNRSASNSTKLGEIKTLCELDFCYIILILLIKKNQVNIKMFQICYHLKFPNFYPQLFDSI